MMNLLIHIVRTTRSIIVRPPPYGWCAQKTKGPKAATCLDAPWRQGHNQSVSENLERRGGLLTLFRTATLTFTLSHLVLPFLLQASLNRHHDLS